MRTLKPYSQGSCFQERWPQANAIVKRILNMEYVSAFEWQNMFEDIHLITSWEESACEAILASLTESIKEAIRRSQQRVMENQDESAVLKAYINEWAKFFRQSEFLPEPFSPLENFLFGKHNLIGPTKRKLQDSIMRKRMLDAWDETIFEEIKQRLEDSAMKLIQDEREGATIDSALVIGVRESYVNLSTTSTTKVWTYVGNFETAYIKSMETFYRPRTAQFIAEKGIRNYLAYAQRELAEEEARARWYLDSGPLFNSISKHMDACVQVFVVEYQDEIMSEFPKLLRENDTVRLRQCYRLMKRAPKCLPPMLEQLEEFIWNAGTAELRASADVLVKDASRYVNCLLDMFHRFSTMVEQALDSDSAFLTARDKAYQRLVNDTTIFSMDLPTSVRKQEDQTIEPRNPINLLDTLPSNCSLTTENILSRMSLSRKTSGAVRWPESRCPEHLASYCDMLLRKSPTSRRLPSDEILAHLKHVLLVLKYVNSKDVFMRGHKSHLMRRLILGTSADNELEELIVERLREAGMPAELVNSLARMLQDVKLSHDLTLEFNEKAMNNNAAAASLCAEAPGVTSIFSPELVNIKILSSGTWLPRTQPKVSIALPPELEDFIPQVEEFYKQKHQGRNLVWQYHLSHGVVAYFPEGNGGGHIELEITTLQIVVLFAWRHRMEQRLPMDSLLTATGLSDAELRRTLWSLAEHPKMECQLILYAPQVASEKDYNNLTEFWINPAFGFTRPGRGQNHRRINLIGRLQLTQTTCEEESLAIVHLRQLRAQEAIIKIMKVRKRLAFQEIYKELIALLKDQFIPSKRLLKEVIEWLIQGRYIQREINEIDTFVYTS